MHVHGVRVEAALPALGVGRLGPSGELGQVVYVWRACDGAVRIVMYENVAFRSISFQARVQQVSSEHLVVVRRYYSVHPKHTVD